MKYIFCFFLFFGLSACKTQKASNPISHQEILKSKKSDFTIAFGSGNNQRKKNPFWNDILALKPDVWIWGGDNIYCDTENMVTLAKCYTKQRKKADYKNFIDKVEIIGVWDDHDYGVNDGGAEYPKKEASQKLYLDFLDVSKSDARRKQKGTYHVVNYKISGKNIKIILLDTRYFRTALSLDKHTNKRYKPNKYGVGTILGEKQWVWIENELKNSNADYNIIISSIQFLSDQHGFEAWGTMPHEVDRMEATIIKSKAKGVIILSGDRHISEISLKEIGSEKYKLLDFTSSGLTHSYTGYTGEPNPFRVSDVIYQKSYGIVKFNLKNKKVNFEMWGKNKTLLYSYVMQF